MQCFCGSGESIVPVPHHVWRISITQEPSSVTDLYGSGSDPSAKCRSGSTSWWKVGSGSASNSKAVSGYALKWIQICLYNPLLSGRPNPTANPTAVVHGIALFPSPPSSALCWGSLGPYIFRICSSNTGTSFPTFCSWNKWAYKVPERIVHRWVGGGTCKCCKSIHGCTLSMHVNQIPIQLLNQSL